MKKTVFLFLLFIGLITTNQVSASSEEIYQFETYQIRLNFLSNSNNGKGYHVTKLGEEPFEKNIIFDNQWVTINQVTEVKGYHVFYGYTHPVDGATYYDAFLTVLDASGNEVFTLLEDFGDLEAIKQVFTIDNQFIIHLVQSIDQEERIVFSKNIFQAYDFNFNKINELETNNEYVQTEVTENMYLLYTDYDDFVDGAILSDFTQLEPNQPLPIETNQVFNESVDLLFLNDALLNNSIIHNGVFIDYPGNYELTYNGFTYMFHVKPSVTGVLDNEIYSHSITPVISNGNIYLNNDLFISNTEISDPGNYTLQIIGKNGYTETYSFVITSNVEGVLHNQTYYEPVEITFNGEGYLNNKYIESPFIVSTNGDYILKIEGEGDYLETYYFSIESEIDDTSFIRFIQTYDVVFLGIVVITGGIILKKK